MNIIAFIFARGGSKGLPNKNIKPLAGKPLIAWSIEQAKSVKAIKRVIVSTDSDQIAEVAFQYGAEVPFKRPSELANDDTPEWLAWRHALNFLKDETGNLPDAILSIPATAPLRHSDDIVACINEFKKYKPDAVITVSDAHRSPYFNMVKKTNYGLVELVIPPNGVINRRQDSPVVYDMATVAYVLDPSFILKNSSLFSGKVRAVHVPIERAIDIDTPFDFDLAEFLMERRIKVEH
ncbi:acylneuraminate cytidylyltransferase family protein [Leptospira levettii]|uniref:acylneuraminate cytidylyltransferase family protein n=1 Tax=Leptospira levettii TaxID=2023178 RepID=UPI00223E6B0E|nr:acylneuraminate cytidylyltransferase family protein [Leptospira levettii]MCW7497022.1 acylneuraminate cytidylyltransferase family protein [Leptospira levettii]